jgi:Flp pilus assembly protein TadD
VNDLTLALSITPNDTNVMMNRGLSLLFGGDTPAACADWRKAVDLGSRRCAALLRENCQGG